MRPSPPPPLPPAKVLTVSSSPGRAEKLPAPGFARLLRGKGGSRSRSRSRSRSSLSRSSPLFSSRSRNFSRAAAASSMNAAAEEGEPSSPKVTCIGQVRIRNKKRKDSGIPDRSIPKGNEQQKEGGGGKIRFGCLQRSTLCTIFPGRRRTSRHCSIWPGWLRGFRFEGNPKRRQRKERLDPAATAPTAGLALPPQLRILGVRGRERIITESGGAQKDGLRESEEETRVFDPPKNALILMRCRSAPLNRSSALSNRFFTSPIAAPAAADEDWGEGGEEEDARTEAASGIGAGSSGGGEEMEVERCPSLSLKRCMSEPEKIAGRLASTAANCGCDGSYHRP